MKGELQEKNKSNITIATDNRIWRELKKDAELKGVSLNVLINSLLQKHVMFFRHVERQGVVLPKATFSSLINFLPEDKLAEAFASTEKGGIESVGSILLQNGIELTMDNIVKYVFEGIALWAGSYAAFNHYTDAQGHLCLAFEHDHGIKYSRLLGLTFCNAIKHLVNFSTHLQTTNTTILIRVDTR